MRALAIIFAAVAVLAGCAQAEPDPDPAAVAIAAVRESATQLDTSCANPPELGSTQSCLIRNKIQVDAMADHLGKIPATVGAMELNDARANWHKAWMRWNSNSCVADPGPIDCTLATTHANLNATIIEALAEKL